MPICTVVLYNNVNDIEEKKEDWCQDQNLEFG